MKHKPLICLLFLISNMVVISFSVNSYATAPIPQLIVKVKNAPDELYYLDLLKNSPSGQCNLSDIEKYNKDMLDLLYSYESEGWYPSLVCGTNAPLWGDLVGKRELDRVSHKFEYFGLPLIYRIIIVTESGDVQVSRVMTRTSASMQSTITYDYKSDMFITTPTWLTYLISFAVICIPTIGLELIILILFKFKLRYNWKPFLFMNMFTLLLLIITMGVTFNNTNKMLYAYLILIPTELAIFSIEMFIGVKFLRGRSPQTRVVYVFCSNLISTLVSIVWLIPITLNIITNI